MNNGLNKLLERQVKRVFESLDKVPKEIEPLLALISETYNHNEEDRAMIERSMEISSKELSDLNHRLQLESSALRMKLGELENINKLVIDRENKLADLKSRVSELEQNSANPQNPGNTAQK